MAGSMGRPEVKQVEDLLHRDLRAKPVEIDPWHGFVPDGVHQQRIMAALPPEPPTVADSTPRAA
jgi:hypothetical protein